MPRNKKPRIIKLSKNDESEILSIETLEIDAELIDIPDDYEDGYSDFF